MGLVERLKDVGSYVGRSISNSGNYIIRKAGLFTAGTVMMLASGGLESNIAYADTTKSKADDILDVIADAETPREILDRKINAERTLEALNDFRKVLGLNSVRYNRDLCNGARRHANYLKLNKVWFTTSINPHKEDKDKPGYSVEGEKAARGNIFRGGDPFMSIESFMEGLYHRIPLINPHLKEIGLGFAKAKKDGSDYTFTVLDFDFKHQEIIRSKLKDELYQKKLKDLLVVSYPVDDQKNVNTLFNEYENPDPIPFDVGGRAGYLISTTFFSSILRKVSDFEWQLEDEDGVKYTPRHQKINGMWEGNVWEGSPEKPANPGVGQGNTLSLMTEDPMKYGTLYTITMKANLHMVGENIPIKWSKTWSFKTMGTRLEKPLGNLKPGYSRGK